MTRRVHSRLSLCWLGAALLAFGNASAAETKGVLRVCGDPDNMPFSNEKLEGIENKIATVVSKDLGWELEYTWWPHQRGLIKRVLNTHRCDVLLGIPKGLDQVLWTKPYYRTGYVMTYRKDRLGKPLSSLDDPALAALKVGVQVNTPPHVALGTRGLVGDNVRAYQLMFDSNFHPEDYPGKIVEDLIAGGTDVALVWGPIAGYFQKKKAAPFLALVPLAGDRSGGMAFDISMGVRKADAQLKTQLEAVLDRQHGAIRRILEDYGVPLLPIEAAHSEVAAHGREGRP